MPIDVTFDPIGRSFIPQVLNNQTFRNKGFLTGKSATDVCYVVVDPDRHPLYVWEKDSSGYENTAKALGAAAFSNGPMMEQPGKAGMAGMIGAVTVGAGSGAWAAGATTSYFNLAGPWGTVVFIGMVAIGGAAGAYAAYKAGAVDWRPYNIVDGDRHSIYDSGAGYNGELAWFGRSKDTTFDSYAAGRGPVPTVQGQEVIAGLIPLLLNLQPEQHAATQPACVGPVQLQFAISQTT